MTFFNRLFKVELPKNKFGAYTVYQKNRLGSDYPNLTNEEKKELKKLFPGLKKRSKKVLKEVEHPDFIYEAINIVNKNGW
ncbi:MAG: hypothetical protein WCD89_27485 [Anaerocolumna sp.]